MTPPDRFPPTVSTTWLAEHLGRPELVVLDASWYLPTSGRDPRTEYLAAHLPGAAFFDLDEASDPGTTLPHMLPDAARFEAVARRLGVGNDSHIVVYDGSGANLSAARAWWQFRVFGATAVALLDGGLPRWRQEGRPLEGGAVIPKEGGFIARLAPGVVRDLAEVREALLRGSAQVVDMRPAGRFAGSEPEPRAGIPSGHMPGALNLPYTELVDGGGALLAPEVLAARLTGAGVRLDRPVIATCGSGVSACALLLALERLGIRDYALYDGAWTEWAGAGMPVTAGPSTGGRAP